MSLPPLTDFGWSTDDNILSVIWDTEANVKRIYLKMTVLLLTPELILLVEMLLYV
jgi:hypothetical protein